MNRLRELRKSKNMTQIEFAEKMNITQNAVSRYESGYTDLSIDQAKEFAAFFGVSIDYLLGNTETKKAAQIERLDSELLSMMISLNPEQVQRVRDFVAGMKSSRKD